METLYEFILLSYVVKEQNIHDDHSTDHIDGNFPKIEEEESKSGYTPTMTTLPKKLRQLGMGTPVEDYWREKEKYEKAFIDYYVIRLNKSYFNYCFNFL